MNRRQQNDIHNNDIHIAEIEGDVLTTAWSDQVWFKNAKVFGAILRWTVVAIAIVWGWWGYQHDLNAQNLVSLEQVNAKQEELDATAKIHKVEFDNQIRGLRESTVSRERFEERTQAIGQRLDRIEAGINQLLNHK